MAEKQLNVKELMRKRVSTPLRIKNVEDRWMKELTESNKEYEFFIETTTFGNNREDRQNKERLFLKYNLCAIFDLSNFIPGTMVNLTLFMFSKTQPATVKIAKYNNTLRCFGSNPNLLSREPQTELAESYPLEYENYLDMLEKWVNNNTKPSDTKCCEFNEINYSDLEENNLSPKRYLKDYFTIKELLNKEQTVKLEDVADIICPRPVDDRKTTGKFLISRNFKYPLDYSELLERPATNLTLEKGDILVKPIQGVQFYLIDEEPNEPLYVNMNWFVLKAKKDVSPEYLYLYLNSETSKKLMECLSVGVSLTRLPMSKIKEIPVILPQNDNNYYKTLFKMQNYSNANIQEVKKFIANSTITEVNKVEDILDKELINKVKDFCYEEVAKILEEDLNEINLCYKAKAYKATLILCGSVLEAFLLDWLNELQPDENWFDKTTYINKEGKECIAGLDYYINKIAKISTPPWMKQMKENAFTIKNKRNLVHAKLCLKDDVQINEETCKNVITFLKEIIRQR